MEMSCFLTSESVEGPSLSFEGVDNVHGSHRLPFGVFSVGHGVSDDIFQEDLEDSAGFLVDESRDTLDSSTAGQTTDGRFRDPLDVVTEDFPVSLGSSFPESFASFTTASHGGIMRVKLVVTWTRGKNEVMVGLSSVAGFKEECGRLCKQKCTSESKTWWVSTQLHSCAALSYRKKYFGFGFGSFQSIDFAFNQSFQCTAAIK